MKRIGQIVMVVALADIALWVASILFANGESWRFIPTLVANDSFDFTDAILLGVGIVLIRFGNLRSSSKAVKGDLFGSEKLLLSADAQQYVSVFDPRDLASIGVLCKTDKAIYVVTDDKVAQKYPLDEIQAVSVAQTKMKLGMHHLGLGNRGSVNIALKNGEQKLFSLGRNRAVDAWTN